MNITSALNGLKILKTKKLERNLTDIQMQTIVTQCLLSSDLLVIGFGFVLSGSSLASSKSDSTFSSFSSFKSLVESLLIFVPPSIF